MPTHVQLSQPASPTPTPSSGPRSVIRLPDLSTAPRRQFADGRSVAAWLLALHRWLMQPRVWLCTAAGLSLVVFVTLVARWSDGPARSTSPHTTVDAFASKVAKPAPLAAEHIVSPPAAHEPEHAVLDAHGPSPRLYPRDELAVPREELRVAERPGTSGGGLRGISGGGLRGISGGGLRGDLGAGLRARADDQVVVPEAREPDTLGATLETIEPAGDLDSQRREGPGRP